jgi:hypothetical protein
MCNQYLTEEASHFVSHYFEPEVRCRYRDLPMHDDGGENNDRSGVLPIFTHPVRFHGRGKTKLIDDEDLKIAHRYVDAIMAVNNNKRIHPLGTTVWGPPTNTTTLTFLRTISPPESSAKLMKK